MKKKVMIVAACCIISTLHLNARMQQADIGPVDAGKTGILHVPQVSKNFENAKQFSFNPKAVGKKAELFIRTLHLTPELAKKETHLDSLNPYKKQILFEVLARIPGQKDPKQVFNFVLSESDIGKQFAYAIDKFGEVGIGFLTEAKATGEEGSYADIKVKGKKASLWPYARLEHTDSGDMTIVPGIVIG